MLIFILSERGQAICDCYYGYIQEHDREKKHYDLVSWFTIADHMPKQVYADYDAHFLKEIDMVLLVIYLR